MATFQDLQLLQTQGYPVRTLSVTGTCQYGVQRPFTQVFSAETTPDALIVDAIRISLAIPYVFYPHPLYVRRDGVRVVDHAHRRYVDGGLLANFPVTIFDQRRFSVYAPDPTSSQPVFNEHTLGFSLQSDLTMYEALLQSPAVPDAAPVLHLEDVAGKQQSFTNGFIRCIHAVVETALAGRILEGIMDCQQNALGGEHNWSRTVFVSPGQVLCCRMVF